MTQTTLISPYGGNLVDLMVPAEDADALRQHANTLPQVILSERSLCDLELLAVGGFSPLKTFMNQADFEVFVNDMRRADGTLWPMPIPLPVDDETRDLITVGNDVALVDRRRNILAVMTDEEKYAWDMEATAQNVFGTQDTRRPIAPRTPRLRANPPHPNAGPRRTR